jgi:hypothetical protein
MVPADIPNEVQAFLAQRIDSIPELEALLILSEHSHQPWNAAALAARLYVTEAQARVILEALERRQLLSAIEGGYRFEPADEAERALVGLVAITYRANLVTIANFIHRKASTSVMEFARAFHLKKDH